MFECHEHGLRTMPTTHQSASLVPKESVPFVLAATRDRNHLFLVLARHRDTAFRDNVRWARRLEWGEERKVSLFLAWEGCSQNGILFFFLFVLALRTKTPIQLPIGLVTTKPTGIFRGGNDPLGGRAGPSFRLSHTRSHPRPEQLEDADCLNGFPGFSAKPPLALSPSWHDGRSSLCIG